MPRHGFEIAGLGGEPVRVSSTQLEELSSRISGRLLRAGDAGWVESIRIWNGLAATTPALSVQPASISDVPTVVEFARERNLLVSIKGGGHNIAGMAIADKGLVLDMSRLREVAVDPEARLAHVGAGCLLQHVDRATQEHGLATVLGFVSETGVAGLTLGGGFGYLARRFGWTADNLEAVQIVTADGSTLTASRAENADLFWALRGGGGNFGVVTRFTFRLHAVGPTIIGGLIAWSAERAGDVLATYRALTDSAPRELTAAAVVLTAPPAPFIPPAWQGRRLAGMLVCDSGTHPEKNLAPVRSLGDPVVDLVGEMPYVAMQSLLDDSPSEAKGMHQYWKTEYLPTLTPEYIDVFLDRALQATSPLSYSVIFHVGGALNERADDDGAVGNRDARYISGFSGVWPPDDPGADDHVAWVRESWAAMRRFSTGGNYVNFQLAEDDDERTVQAYGRNYERLRQVKARYDPANLFRVNRNIAPAQWRMT
jgi:FAD/FMN-containing dehydrogenase